MGQPEFASRDEYDAAHQVCPQCKGHPGMRTTMGRISFPGQSKFADNNHVNCCCGWKGRVDDLIPKAEPKTIFPQCPECGYGEIENGDRTRTITMRQSAYLYGQDCKACGIRFGHEAEASRCPTI